MTIPNDTAGLLDLRTSQHGHFPDQARYTQQLKAILHSSPNWARLEPIQQEALEMDVHKTARILAGDPNWVDHWKDKIGYCQLVVDYLFEGTRTTGARGEASGQVTGSEGLPRRPVPVRVRTHVVGAAGGKSK